MNDFNPQAVLAIDSSTHILKLALSFGDDRLVKVSEEVEKSHGQVIVKKIDELFQSADLNKSMLRAIVVVTGPGSFTGLRIGLAVAKGMATALSVPVVGVDVFEVAAYKLGDEHENVKVVIPLTRDQFFTAEIKNGSYDLSEITTISKNDLLENTGKALLTGIGINLSTLIPDHEDILLPGEIMYDASDILYLGLKKLLAGHHEDLASLEPLYIQKSQAEIKFEKRRLEK